MEKQEVMNALEEIKDKLNEIDFETISLARGNAKKEILIDDVEEASELIKNEFYQKVTVAACESRKEEIDEKCPIVKNMRGWQNATEQDGSLARI